MTSSDHDYDNALAFAHTAADAHQYAQAEAVLRDVLNVLPNDAATHFEYALLLGRTGRTDAAIPHLAAAVRADPCQARYWLVFAEALLALKQCENALTVVERGWGIGLRGKPVADLYCRVLDQLAERAIQDGHQDEAVAYLKRALAFMPESPALLTKLGHFLAASGFFTDALQVYRQAAAIQPDFTPARWKIPEMLDAMGMSAAANAEYIALLTEEKNSAELYHNYAIFLLSNGFLGDSILLFNIAIKIDSNMVETWYALAKALFLQGSVEASIEALDRALTLSPNHRSAASSRLFALNYSSRFDPGMIVAAYKDWGRRLPNRPSAFDRHLASEPVSDPERRLRIGYVSPDLHRHPMRFFVEPLLDQHDPREFEIHVYSDVAREDEVTAKMKQRVAEINGRWYSVRNQDDDALAQKIQRDGIDILIDLAGHSAGSRLAMFALKPAPLAIACLGTGSTTGVPQIDYFLADPLLAPSGSDVYFTETLIRLPVFTAYRPPCVTVTPVDRNLFDQRPITFGCLSRLERISDPVVRCWAEILQRIPDARLVVNTRYLADEPTRNSLRQRFTAAGVSPDRLMFGFETPPWDILNQIDISLDCFPHNSGTTLFESILMGVPVIPYWLCGLGRYRYNRLCGASLPYGERQTAIGPFKIRIACPLVEQSLLQ
jgi:protein O-GlcNAc transferase